MEHRVDDRLLLRGLVDEFALVRRPHVQPTAVRPDAALAAVAIAVEQIADGDVV